MEFTTRFGLHSSTTSPARSPGAKATPVRQRTPCSIKQWLSPGGVSPRPQNMPSPHPRSPAGCGNAERRAKRRLETDAASPTACQGAERCECVTELYPEAKRSRAQSGTRLTAQESRVQGNRSVEDKQVSPRPVGKENCSPRAADWLSAMGQKMKKGPGGPGSPRSPSGSKKHEGKTPASPTICSPKSMKKISAYFMRAPRE